MSSSECFRLSRVCFDGFRRAPPSPRRAGQDVIGGVRCRAVCGGRRDLAARAVRRASGGGVGPGAKQRERTRGAFPFWTAAIFSHNAGMRYSLVASQGPMGPIYIGRHHSQTSRHMTSRWFFTLDPSEAYLEYEPWAFESGSGLCETNERARRSRGPRQRRARLAALQRIGAPLEQITSGGFSDGPRLGVGLGSLLSTVAPRQARSFAVIPSRSS